MNFETVRIRLFLGFQFFGETPQYFQVLSYRFGQITQHKIIFWLT